MFGYDPYDPYNDPFYGRGPGLGVDITDGDLVENIGGGFGIDIDPFSPNFGDLEFEVAPGIDIPL